MGRSLTDLGSQMDRLIVGLPAQANELKKKVARTVNFDLLQVTPVDQGVAMSNWIAQNGTASAEIRPAFAPGPKGKMVTKDGKRVWQGSGDTESVRQANAAPALEAAEEVFKQAKPGEPIHLTNNLPYIQALDQGHSNQAVEFVERAIILGTATLSRATIS